MWYVFNKGDSWECGISVTSEKEAKRRCQADSNLTYCFVCVIG